MARTIVTARMRSLEGHALGEIQAWTDADEAVVAELRTALRSGDATAVARARAKGAYAAHVVAAAVTEAVQGGGDPRALQTRMIAALDAMHRAPARVA